MKIAYLTGATGCVGRNLVDILLQDDWKIICLHRQTSDLSRLDGCDVEFREVNLYNSVSTNKAIKDKADVIFHIAANLSHNSKHYHQQFKDNILVTENLLYFSQNIDKFIFTSTGATSSLDHLLEDIIKIDIKSGYVKTKKLAELRVNSIRPDAIILRPGIIIGKYDYNNYSMIFNLLKSRKLKNAIPGVVDFCDATQIAKAHLSAYYNGKYGEIYTLGGEHTSWYDICCRICTIMNIKKVKPPLPIFIYYLVAYFMILRQYITNKEAFITPNLVSLIGQTYKGIPDTEKQKSLLDLNYKCDNINKALQECYNWLNSSSNKWINK